jgi:signal transduction histidine kinase
MRRRGAAITVSLSWAVICAAFAAGVVIDRSLAEAGRSDLSQFDVEAVPFIAAVLSASAVGAILAVRRPEQPVGWLFLALGGSVAVTGVFDGYGLYGTVARPDSVPAADLVAVLGEAMFIPWFVLVALILQLTPTGRPLTRRWGIIAAATVVAGGLWFAIALVWPETLDPPLDHVRSPIALPVKLVDAMGPLRVGLGVLTSAGLVTAGISLLVRFRRSAGMERRRLLWLAIVVVPLPVYVAVSWFASPDHPLLLAAATGGFICLIPIATGLSIARYHLYDVDQILSRAVTYLLVTGVLAATFATVVVSTGRVVGDQGGGSDLPAVLGTLAAAVAATPVYRAFQEAVDRRFNRRRFEAVRLVREYVRAPTAQSVEDVLRTALPDPTLRVAYWVTDRRQWVTEDGRPVDTDPGEIEIRRHGDAVARVAYEQNTIDPGLAEAATTEATPELVSAGLRAAISLQLTEVRESRRRIAAAQLNERRRIERNLHDGAQQRLLALALQLQAAQVNGGVGRLQEAVATGVSELQAAVAELRELANGLHPAVLSDSGLGAALDDLASRLPLPVKVHATDHRFAPQVESTAWFIACEAISNAIKHAHASEIEVTVHSVNGAVTVRVGDDGCGEADARGAGLRGLADRADAIGGALTVTSPAGGGTIVTGELPCGS